MSKPTTKRWITIPESEMGSWSSTRNSPFATQGEAAKNAIGNLDDDGDEVVYICYIVGVARVPKGEYVSYEQAKREKRVE